MASSTDALDLADLDTLEEDFQLQDDHLPGAVATEEAAAVMTATGEEKPETRPRHETMAGPDAVYDPEIAAMALAAKPPTAMVAAFGTSAARRLALNAAQKKAKADAVYDAKIAAFRSGAAANANGSGKKSWQKAGVVKAKVHVVSLSTSPTPHQSSATQYGGRFGAYDTAGAVGSESKSGMFKMLGTLARMGAKKEEAPDPWAGFVMPENVDSESDDDEECPPRSGEELWKILKSKWKIFRASKGMLMTMRTVHGTSGVI